MTFEELLEKYQALLSENDRLREEIIYLNSKLGVSEHRAITDGASDSFSEDSLFPCPNAVLEVSNQLLKNETLQLNINNIRPQGQKLSYSCHFLKDGMMFMLNGGKTKRKILES